MLPTGIHVLFVSNLGCCIHDSNYGLQVAIRWAKDRIYLGYTLNQYVA
jgi:hypothetical protein